MDIAQLLIIEEFMRIHKEEGPRAAILWANEQEDELDRKVILEECGSLDKKPHLRIVR